MLNNHDRLPLLWDNLGNLQNAMLAPCGVVGIDQEVAPILHPAAVEQYPGSGVITRIRAEYV